MARRRILFVVADHEHARCWLLERGVDEHEHEHEHDYRYEKQHEWKHEHEHWDGHRNHDPILR